MHDFKDKYPVKERIFIIYMFFFAFLSAFTVICNILYGLNFSFNYKWIFISLFSIILMLFSIKRERVLLVHHIGVYGIIFIIHPASWLSSSGLVSPSIIYSLLVMLLINYLIRGKERIILNIVFILINMLLISLYRFYPSLYKTMTPHEQFLDWIINVPLVFIFIAMLLIIFEKAYEEERVLNEEKSKKLLYLSRTDYLTGLFNRSQMEEKLSFLHTLYIRTGVPYSIIIIDIDYFKSYNDHYGHLQGDRCLKLFSSILKKCITRESDWIIRYGGEEFLVILGFTERKGAEVVAANIQKDLSDSAIPHDRSTISSLLTVSMGIATIRDPKQTPEEILKFADTALYISKKKGRNRISHFDDIDKVVLV